MIGFKKGVGPVTCAHPESFVRPIKLNHYPHS
jgi:hypothetical protein